MRRHINSFLYVAAAIFFILALFRVLNLLDANIVALASLMAMFFTLADFIDYYLDEKVSEKKVLIIVLFYISSILAFICLFSIVIATAMYLGDSTVFATWSLGIFGDIATLISLAIVFLYMAVKNSEFRQIKADLIKAEKVITESLEANKAVVGTLHSRDALVMPVGVDKYAKDDDSETPGDD